LEVKIWEAEYALLPFFLKMDDLLVTSLLTLGRTAVEFKLQFWIYI